LKCCSQFVSGIQYTGFQVAWVSQKKAITNSRVFFLRTTNLKNGVTLQGLIQDFSQGWGIILIKDKYAECVKYLGALGIDTNLGI
jgi:hypothetical protein